MFLNLLMTMFKWESDNNTSQIYARLKELFIGAGKKKC